MSELSQSELEAMEAALRAYSVLTPGRVWRVTTGGEFRAGWLAHREFSRSSEAVERAAKEKQR